MAVFTNKFDSAKQEWETPQALFNKINERFRFNVDLAADKNNTKCDRFFSEEEDALSMSWQGLVGWLNPPYGSKKSKLSDWVKKSYFESVHNGATVVMLIPARTNTKWWRDYCMKAQSIIFLCGRPKFGGSRHGLPQPLALVVFMRQYGIPQPCKYESMEVYP